MSEAVAAQAPVTDAAPQNSINQNEQTGANQEEVTVHGGDNAVSFDELDSLHTKSDTTGVGKKPKAEKSEKIEKNREKNVAKEQQEVDAAVEETVKLLKGTRNGKSKDFEADYAFDVTVNGETVQVPLQEMVNSFSGQKEIQRRFSQLDLDRQTLSSERDSVNKFLDAVVAKSSDPMELINYLVESAGEDPVRYQSKLFEALAPHVEEWQSLSDEEREQKLMARENEVLKKQLAAQTEAREETQDFTELKKEVESIKQEFEMDDTAFFDTFNEMVESGLDRNDISPTDVRTYLEDKQLAESIVSEIKQRSPEFPNADDVAIEILDHVDRNASLDAEDILAIIEDITADKTEEVVSEKVRASGVQPKPSKELDPASAPIGFDDLE